MLPKVVDSWPIAVEWSTQTDFSRQNIECPSDFRLIQAIASLGDKEVFGASAAREIIVSPEAIFRQFLLYGRVQRHEAKLMVFCATNRQHTLL
jgi:hypothetical protein